MAVEEKIGVCEHCAQRVKLKRFQDIEKSGEKCYECQSCNKINKESITTWGDIAMAGLMVGALLDSKKKK